MTRKKDPRTARLPVADIVAKGGQLPAFTPVPRLCERHDGWTPERQRGFIEALADTGSVDAACKAVNMSSVGAYHLRRQPGAEEFRAAWETALALGVQRVEDVVMDRALNGVEELVYSYGKLVGTCTRYNDRLLMFILRNRAPERFGAHGTGGQRASSMGGLNAVGQMEVERLKKQWRKEYEASQANVSTAALTASIDRKVERLRQQIEAERAAAWAQLSEETRAAWAQFVALRDRDLDAAAASADEREWVNVSSLHDAEGRPRVKQFVPLKPPPPPPPPKTEWTVKDESFDP